MGIAFLKNYEIENLESENPSASFSLRTTLLKVRSKKNIKALVESDKIIYEALKKIRKEWLKSEKYLSLVKANATNKEFIDAEIEFNKAKEALMKKFDEETEKYKQYCTLLHRIQYYIVAHLTKYF